MTIRAFTSPIDHYHVFQQRWGEYVYIIQYMSGLKGYPADSRRRDVKVAAVAGWLIRENMFSYWKVPVVVNAAASADVPEPAPQSIRDVPPF